MWKRIVSGIILLFILFFAPWWVAALLSAIFIFVFNNYWEGVFVAILLDVLYSIPNTRIYGHFGIFTFIGLFLFLVSKNFKKKLRFFI